MSCAISVRPGPYAALWIPIDNAGLKPGAMWTRISYGDPAVTATDTAPLRFVCESGHVSLEFAWTLP